MATGFYTWSQTAGANANADSAINYSEGQAPSSVNDSARAMMAALAKYRDDTGSNLQTAGTSTAYTLTTNQVFDTAPHMATQELSFFVHATNGASPTLTVDGLGPYPIYTDGNFTAVPTGSMVSGGVYTVVFSFTQSSFRLIYFYFNPYNIPIGGLMDYIGATVPNSNFVFPIGQAISRTTYATLFALVGTLYGVGDGSTTFNVPNLSGRVTAMKEATATLLTTAGGGIDGGTLGAVGGAQNIALTTAQLAAHTHANSLTDPGHTHTYQQPSSFQSSGANIGILGTSVTANTGSSTTGVTITNASAGSGSAHNNVQPTFMLNKILRII